MSMLNVTRDAETQKLQTTETQRHRNLVRSLRASVSLWFAFLCHSVALVAR